MSDPIEQLRELQAEVERLEAKVEKLKSIISHSHAEIRFELRHSEQEVNDLMAGEE